MCMRKPGAAFTSSTAPPFSCNGFSDIRSHDINAANIETDDACNAFAHKHIIRMHNIGNIG